MIKNIDNNWKIFYQDDMEQLGYLFKYAGEILNFDMNVFVKEFMNSWHRKQMDNWHPKFSNESAEDLYNHYRMEHESDFPYDNESVYAEDELMWIGSAYGFLRYYTSLSSIEIYSKVDFKTMRLEYKLGHELDWFVWADRLLNDLNAN